LPHYQLTLEDRIAEDDKVVVRTRLVARHERNFMGIPATHKQVDVPG
jgi:predicted ester cyclase